VSQSIGRCVIVGRGRAGRSFAGALGAAGWNVELVAARPLVEHDLAGGPGSKSADESIAASITGSLAGSIASADLVMIAVPDAAIASTAMALPPTQGLVVHISGATGLDVLDGHARVGSIHPLISLPDADTGALRLRDQCTFAVDGDPSTHDIVGSLGGRPVEVPTAMRPLYHAAASVAANHLTALCAQVERLASTVGVPVDAYWKMMAATLDNVADSGAAAALTGPAARGDWDTVRIHLAALPEDEQALYRALMVEAASVAGNSVPSDLTIN
jgi:predicted short-subunit dehydrogenase-like oxidoreductase (DUF2520 family)